jgi:CheY-like chemotaxis protein
VRRQRILIVEDSKSDVFLMREAIAKAQVDAEIHIVQDGHDAIRYFDVVAADTETPCPDLILLDMNLPKQTGDEVLKYLRRMGRCSSAKVLIVSSSDAPRDRASVEAYSLAGYFRKPSNYREFMKLGPLVKGLLEPGS